MTSMQVYNNNLEQTILDRSRVNIFLEGNLFVCLERERERETIHVSYIPDNHENCDVSLGLKSERYLRGKFNFRIF